MRLQAGSAGPAHLGVLPQPDGAVLAAVGRVLRTAGPERGETCSCL